MNSPFSSSALPAQTTSLMMSAAFAGAAGTTGVTGDAAEQNYEPAHIDPLS
jgi:ABC-type uncharacterized transport system permease subunit